MLSKVTSNTTHVTPQPAYALFIILILVKKEIVSKITELGKIEKEKLSKRSWPIKGGHDLSKVLNENKSRDESMQNILLTGESL